jgi:hypothetical protein
MPERGHPPREPLAPPAQAAARAPPGRVAGPYVAIPDPSPWRGFSEHLDHVRAVVGEVRWPRSSRRSAIRSACRSTACRPRDSSATSGSSTVLLQRAQGFETQVFRTTGGRTVVQARKESLWRQLLGSPTP